MFATLPRTHPILEKTIPVDTMPIQSFAQLISDGLSSQAAQLYQEEGILCVRQLISRDEISEIRKEFTNHVESNENISWTVNGKVVDADIAPDDILKKYPRYSMPHRHDDMIPGRIARRLITDRRIYDVAENLIGTTWAAQSMFYFKPPTARGQALHQDNFFLQTHPETCLAAWIAIDDADAENGALEVVPGSHTYDIACPEEADPSLSFSSQGLKIPSSFTKIQSELQAGDVLFFHGSLIHGSLPNTSSDRFRRVSLHMTRMIGISLTLTQSLIFHYIPQGSVEVAKFYQPLLTRDGKSITIGESVQGGECGTAWANGAA